VGCLVEIEFSKTTANLVEVVFSSYGGSFQVRRETTSKLHNDAVKDRLSETEVGSLTVLATVGLIILAIEQCNSRIMVNQAATDRWQNQVDWKPNEISIAFRVVILPSRKRVIDG